MVWLESHKDKCPHCEELLIVKQSILQMDQIDFTNIFSQTLLFVSDLKTTHKYLRRGHQP